MKHAEVFYVYVAKFISWQAVSQRGDGEGAFAPIYILTMLPILLPSVIVMGQGQLDEVTLGESSQGDAHMWGHRDH